MNILEKLAAKKHALGIPDRTATAKIPKLEAHPTKFSIQFHHAHVRGPHYDLRIKVGNKALSWALQNLPKEGKPVYAIEQPPHSVSYMTWEGEIPKGQYGAGTVKLHRHGDAEIISADSKKIHFAVYDGPFPEEYVLVNMGKGKVWKLFKKKPNPPPIDKPKYKTLPEKEVHKAPEIFEALSAKLDGAHSIVHLGKPGELIRVYSPRISKVTGERIEYTHKIPGLLKVRVPKHLANTTLRAETLAVKKNSILKSQGPTNTAAILNTKNPILSKEKQKHLGELKLFAFNIDKFRGKSMKHVPFGEKLKLLERLKKDLRFIELPEVAITPEEKKRLFEKIRAGKHPMTDEGLVGFSLQDAKKKPVKIKFRPDMDVYIREVFPSKRKGWAGGFKYSLTPKGPIVGKVGTGFSDKERRHMLKNPEEWIGRKAVVTFQKGGRKALRAPSFIRLHLDY